ncbi:MAG TPA: hypothetical protein VGO60_04620 [Iamia sp.]|nr:hypothetical protein [Iamia sp.]
MADLEIDVVEGDRDALAAAFLDGSLAPVDLPRLRFRISPDDAWREHPQVRFLTLPLVPAVPLDDGPDLVWQQQVTGSPCGLLPIWHRFARGRKIESALGRAEAPNVTSTVSYDLVLAVMAGEVSASGALERGGDVEGDLSAMLQLLAVFEQPEFVTATREAIGPLGPALRAAGPSRRR